MSASSAAEPTLSESSREYGLSSAGLGPNAIIQLGEAIRKYYGQQATTEVFEHLNLEHYLENPPHSLINENEIIEFHRATRQRFGDNAYRELATVAGRLTGDYLLANRIPKIAQRIIAWAPEWLAIKLLTTAITRNAWTFVGSGSFTTSGRHLHTRFLITDSPLARGLSLTEGSCTYYAATFSRLYAKLVNSRISVVEKECRASGCNHCEFVLIKSSD